MTIFDITLSDKEKAYINLLAHHMNQYKALLTDLAGPATQDATGNPLVVYTRELALANTRLEEAYYHAREHVLRSATKRNAVN
jgi:hypothetical protein